MTEFSKIVPKDGKPPANPTLVRITVDLGWKTIYYGVCATTGILIFAAWMLLVVTIVSAGYYILFGSPPNDRVHANTTTTTTTTTTTLVKDEIAENKEPRPFFPKNIVTRLNTPNMLKAVDHLLIVLTVFFSSFLLLSIAYKLRPPKYGANIDEVFKEVLENLKEAIKGIDISILSMATITLTITFLVYILQDKDSVSGISILYKGTSIGIIIFAIALYIYLTHSSNNKESKNKKMRNFKVAPQKKIIK